MPAKYKDFVDLAERAWGIIANKGGGNWSLESNVWRDAATKWRDDWYDVTEGWRIDKIPADVEISPEANAMAATCWCDPRTSGTVMDATLGLVIAEKFQKLLNEKVLQ